MKENEKAESPDEIPAPPAKHGWGCLQWLFVAVLLFIAAGLAIPQFGAVHESARHMQATHNCRSIICCIKSYADDNKGQYPGGATANDAFRRLFQSGQLEDERVFTAAASPYVPDNDIGEQPDWNEALEPGENHWAMTKGLTNKSPGSIPLVFENPEEPSWPPYWKIDAVTKPVPGRAWKGNMIVIGRNDGSVNMEKLGPPIDSRATLAPDATGKNLFELAGPHEIMQVAK